MRLFRLHDNDVSWLTDLAETFMGVQVTKAYVDGREQLTAVIGSRVIAVLSLPDDEVVSSYLTQDWLSPFCREADAYFRKWLGQLKKFDGSNFTDRTVLPASKLSVTPPVPSILPPEHLPSQRQTRQGDVFYRWEPWPTSRRVNQTTGQVLPGTFGAPFSEAPFVPTGYAAVGRYALPNLLPACFRWELRPPAATTFRCGASVPLYGQAGGGVEVCFSAGFANVGPIANQVVLPPL